MAYMKDSNGVRLDSIKVQPKGSTKRVTAPLTSPNGTTAAAAVDRTQRTVWTIPVASTRWRLRVANRNLLTNTALTTPCTITGLWVGAPLYLTSGTSTNRWVGDFPAAPTQVVASALTVPVDGTDGVTAWITDPAQQFAPHTAKALSWGFTSTNSGTGIASGNSYQGVYLTGSSNAGNATLGGSIAANVNYLDVRVEYEFEGTNTVVLHITDSLGLGYGDGAQGYSSPGAASLPSEAPPVLAGLLGDYAVCNLAIGSATTGTFISPTSYPWTRADLATTVPDAAVIQLGTNSLGAAYSTNAVNLNTHIDSLRTLGIKKIYLATITPRGYTTLAGTLQADAAAAATTVSSSFNPGNVAILIGSGMNQEQVTVSAVSGSGPYTLTVGALVNAHVAGEQITSGSELNRRRLNTWIRNVPYGVHGIIDLERLVEASAESVSCDQRIISADGLHFLRGGYQRIAQALTLVGRKVRFD
jgi:lysophospholipase L1-like esterase